MDLHLAAPGVPSLLLAPDRTTVRVSGGSDGGSESLAGGSWVAYRSVRREFVDRSGEVGAGGGVLGPRWLAGAELALIGAEYVGSFGTRLVLDGVRWPREFSRLLRVPPPRPGGGR